MRKSTLLTSPSIIRSVCFLPLMSAIITGFSISPMARELTPEEEMWIRDRRKQSELLRPEDQTTNQHIIDCYRENAERSNWHYDDYFLNGLFGDESKCDFNVYKIQDHKLDRDRQNNIDMIIEQQLKKALEKAGSPTGQ